MLTIVSAKSKIDFAWRGYLSPGNSIVLENRMLYYSSASQILVDFSHLNRSQVYLRYPYSANMNPPILSKFKQSSNSPLYVHVSRTYFRACQLNDMMIWKDFSFVVTLTLHTGGIRFNFSKEKRSKNKKNCVNNLQEKKEAIGEIDRHRPI